jgi:protein-S-isoprenylcysteine O-methyltransferase Ste14
MTQNHSDNQIMKNPVVVLVLLTSLGIGFGLFASDAYHSFIPGFGILLIFCLIGLFFYIYQNTRRN